MWLVVRTIILNSRGTTPQLIIIRMNLTLITVVSIITNVTSERYAFTIAQRSTITLAMFASTIYQMITMVVRRRSKRKEVRLSLPLISVVSLASYMQ